METEKSLYERINAVKADVSRVPKTGRNQHFGYDFATESDIADTLRPLMAKHGVCLCYHGPDPERFKVEAAGATSKGTPKFRYSVWVKYSVVNAAKPDDRFDLWGYGEALDSEDKGHNKAITNAHKYVHIKLFDVSTGDLMVDPDSSSHLNESGNPNAPPPQRAVAPKAPPSAKSRFSKAVQAWSGVRGEDVKAAANDVARGEGFDSASGLTEDQYAALATFCETQKAAGVKFGAKK